MGTESGTRQGTLARQVSDDVSELDLGEEEADRFTELTRRLVSVPKSEIDAEGQAD